MKSVVSILFGYLIMTAWVVGTLTLGWSTLGQSVLFKEGSYQVTNIWLILSIGLSLVGAVFGGYACTMLAQERQPVRVLALVVLGVGLLFAVIEARSHRSDEVVPTSHQAAVEILSFYEARSVAIEPYWYNFLMAPVGAVGVYIGGMLRLRRLFG